MFNLKSTKTLGIILTLLTIAVLYLYIGDGGRKEKTFNSEIVNIDTSAVTKIVIKPKLPKGKEVKLVKNNYSWKVELTDNKFASVPKKKVNELFSTLQKIKAKRIVSKNKNKWNEFEVGENSTSVKVFENSKKVLDIILGKFTFQQPRSINSYVRLSDENEVYETEGFLEMTFNKDANSFRNNNILNENYKNWKSLKFNYPKDSFELKKVENKWKINNSVTDSLKTENYLRTLSKLTSSEFVDNFTTGDVKKSVKIQTSDSTFVTINLLQADSVMVINSSTNMESYFDASKNGILDKVFTVPKKLTE